MSKVHDRWLNIARAAGLVVVLVAIGYQSYNGRRLIVRAERSQCLNFGRQVLVPLSNSLRASVTGNEAIAADPRQTKATRKARSAEANVERSTLAAFDRQLDPSIIGTLNPEGRAVVEWLEQRGRAFSCAEAYRDASIVQLFS